MTLEKIFMQYGIELRNSEGDLRNLIDVLEDMYLKLSSFEFTKIMFEIGEEERFENLFDLARGRAYRGGNNGN
jgi:hypothetical protein